MVTAMVTSPPFRRKSSIIVAADESTISWGPSPTFGELVSGGRAASRGPSLGPLGPPPESTQDSRRPHESPRSLLVFGSHWLSKVIWSLFSNSKSLPRPCRKSENREASDLISPLALPAVIQVCGDWGGVEFSCSLREG